MVKSNLHHHVLLLSLHQFTLLLCRHLQKDSIILWYNLLCNQFIPFLFSQSSQVSAESNTNSASKTEEKVGEGKFSSHSLDEVAGMIRQTLSIYEAKVESLTFIETLYAKSHR